MQFPDPSEEVQKQASQPLYEFVAENLSQAPPGAPAPIKKSRTWVWIVIAVLAVALLSSCGLCGWASYNIFSSTFKQVEGSMNVVEDYYAAIEAKNYTTAYSYLDPQGTISGLTQDQFTQQARSLDNQYGAVLSFTPGTPAFSSNGASGADFSRFTITIEVRRPKLSYTTLLTLGKAGGAWKIVDFDRI